MFLKLALESTNPNKPRCHNVNLKHYYGLQNLRSEFPKTEKKREILNEVKKLGLA